MTFGASISRLMSKVERLCGQHHLSGSIRPTLHVSTYLRMHLFNTLPMQAQGNHQKSHLLLNKKANIRNSYRYYPTHVCINLLYVNFVWPLEPLSTWKGGGRYEGGRGGRRAAFAKGTSPNP